MGSFNSLTYMHSLYLSSEMRKSTLLRSYTCVFLFLHAVL